MVISESSVLCIVHLFMFTQFHFNAWTNHRRRTCENEATCRHFRIQDGSIKLNIVQASLYEGCTFSTQASSTAVGGFDICIFKSIQNDISVTHLYGLFFAINTNYGHLMSFLNKVATSCCCWINDTTSACTVLLWVGDKAFRAYEQH
mmetsp:Transcript_16395/g.25834  ORF Transcript_16395/g.25834 Transcript_16395/m.25834 type:complete len:147 (+) Transcript_16395:163-603(+)